MADPAPILIDANNRQTGADRGPTVCLVSAAGIDPAALQAFSRRNASRLERYFPGTLRAGDSLQAACAFLDGQALRARDGRGFLLFVLVPECAEPAGLVAVTSVDPDAGLCEIGGMIAERWEGTGLMTKAMRCAFRWCRTELDLRRVRFLIASDNARSLALAAALGFRRESRAGRPFRKGTVWEETLDYFCLDLG
ncbi:hypothetical protein DEA8626_03104 [Defluviimonas aquaemixtae]|uniref:N-acetyltransferase domain-containing protein n=1 Tax=Albidovulum aquaemixtae TaxID=1542388 RepID=A0A2R8BKY1_9RHOB|nr:GNAT family N-acetyltransferase [Defluviimonas aquaemixtae]SPH24056.1 hypothetical protein DEA8626_03104 [Defluviimonas aquaemixtae]